MKTNPFKNFQIYGINVSLLAEMSNLRNAVALTKQFVALESKDPTGATWSTMGFVPPSGGEMALLIDGGKAALLTVQFNDRILPGKVRDEHMAVKVIEVAERESRKVSKREYAEIRDEVEAELLPKSHIRRTIVPVLIYNEHLVIFTSSAKRANDIAALFFRVATNLFDYPCILPAVTQDHASDWLTAIATSEDDSPLVATDSAVMRSKDTENKAVLRIKDKDIDDGEVQAILESNEYLVTELGVFVNDCDNEHSGIAGVTFTLTSKLVIKGMKFPDLTIRSHIGDLSDHDNATQAEFEGMATLVALSVAELQKIIFNNLGGEDRRSYETSKAKTDTEDDEL